MTLRKIQDANVRQRRVFLRIDINVETDGAGARDISRMLAIKPTVDWLVRHGAKIILVAHRGRPDGRDKKLSLKPLLPDLRRVLKQPITFVSTPIYSEKIITDIERGLKNSLVLLENIRFEPGETTNDKKLANRLSQFADLAVNDAFADSHRAHASIVGIAKYLPTYAGLCIQREVLMLGRLLTKPRRPFVAVIGGAKISTKLGLVKKLLKQADAVLLGGALANTVLQAEGVAIGDSLVEPKMLGAAHGLHASTKKLHIPIDVIVCRGKKRSIRRAVGVVKKGEVIFDIGPDTSELFNAIIKTAKTIVWNGPMGKYEIPPYDRGTKILARAIARTPAMTVAGGGETLDAIRSQKLAKQFNFLSTGGGAMLEWLEGKVLPGIEVVMKGKTR